MFVPTSYCCPYSDCDCGFLQVGDGVLSCANGHVFPIIEGTDVPLFECSEENLNEYTIHNAAEVHDNSLRWVFETFGADEASLRSALISRLHLSKGQCVLITGAGAGNDIPYIQLAMDGGGTVYAQDFSKQMLLAAFERFNDMHLEGKFEVYFSVSNALQLPFADNMFDAAYHFGGINLFPDIKQGLAEMNRVVKPGGRIVVGDEGVAPWLKNTRVGKMLINNNNLYDCAPPIEMLPETATDVKVSWELLGSFFVIEFTTSDKPLKINLDVPHIGTRGGTIRTRYDGRLEGINPSLRDEIYERAHKLGISRVDYLEQLLGEVLGLSSGDTR
jgi:SAM-dependent methyltransferase